MDREPYKEPHEETFLESKLEGEIKEVPYRDTFAIFEDACATHTNIKLLKDDILYEQDHYNMETLIKNDDIDLFQLRYFDHIRKSCINSIEKNIDESDYSILNKVCRYDSIKIFIFLYEHIYGSEDFITDEFASGCLLQTIIEHGSIKILEYIVENTGVNISKFTSDAIKSKNISIIKIFCDHVKILPAHVYEALDLLFKGPEHKNLVSLIMKNCHINLLPFYIFNIIEKIRVEHLKDLISLCVPYERLNSISLLEHYVSLIAIKYPQLCDLYIGPYGHKSSVFNTNSVNLKEEIKKKISYLSGLYSRDEIIHVKHILTETKIKIDFDSNFHYAYMHNIDFKAKNRKMRESIIKMLDSLLKT